MFVSLNGERRELNTRNARQGVRSTLANTPSVRTAVAIWVVARACTHEIAVDDTDLINVRIGHLADSSRMSPQVRFIPDIGPGIIGSG